MTDDHDKPQGSDGSEPQQANTPALDEQWGEPAELAPEQPAELAPEQPAEPEPEQPAEPERPADLEPGVPAPEPRATLADIVAADAAVRGDAPPSDADRDSPPAASAGDRAAAAPRRKLDWTQRRTQIAAGLALGAVLLAVMIVLSWLNSRDYYLVCGAEKVTAERGSKFPWGRSALSGKEWKAIEIAPESQCETKTFATLEELREVFAQTLLDEASHRLTSARPEDIDTAEQQLAQALLLTRSIPTMRATIANLQGDVEYWRAASEIKAVIDDLDDAAARFEAAAAKKPRHSTDATQWSGHAAEIAKQLRRGPPELRSDSDYGPNAAPTFTGTETAPAPPRDDTPPGDAPSDDAPPPGTALPAPSDDAPDPRPADRPDAGMPTGGVLL